MVADDTYPVKPRMPPTPERLGLLGGSFDPVHCAHLALAHSALTELELDRVLWIPVGQAWQKARALTPAVHRLAMLRLALANEPRFVVDPRETARAGPSYTLDTVLELRSEHPQAQLFLIVGQDQYAGLHTWHGWERLLPQVALAVAARPGAPPAADAAVRKHPVQWLALSPRAVSASDIRAHVARGAPLADLVPPEVARYIESHRLYRGRNRS